MTEGRAPQTPSSPPVTADLLGIFRTYQRSGSYAIAAHELGLSRSQLKRRLRVLYEQLGISGQSGVSQGVAASYLLRNLPY